MADAGVPQLSPFKKEGEDERYLEEILVTMGDDVNMARQVMKQDENGRWSYSATDVVDYILAKWEAAGGETSYEGEEVDGMVVGVEAEGLVVPSASAAESPVG